MRFFSKNFLKIPLSLWLFFLVVLVYIGCFGKFYAYLNPNDELRFGDKGWMTKWPTTHILCYMIATMLFPEYWFGIFLIGVLWELFEIIQSYFFKLKSGKEDAYWYARNYDIILNSIGIGFGLSLSMLWRTRKNPTKRTIWIKLLVFVLFCSIVELVYNDEGLYINNDENSWFNQCGCTKDCPHISKRLKL